MSKSDIFLCVVLALGALAGIASHSLAFAFLALCALLCLLAVFYVLLVVEPDRRAPSEKSHGLPSPTDVDTGSRDS